MHKDKSQCSSPFFLHSRCKECAKIASDEQNVENLVNKNRPFRLFEVIGRVCFSIPRKSEFQVGFWLDEMLFVDLNFCLHSKF